MQCPRCRKVLEFEKEQGDFAKITCINCGREFINEDVEVAYGVRKIIRLYFQF